MRLINAICLVLVCASCSTHRLAIQTQYFNHENLASYHVGTPDPHLDQPTIGQRLLIQWTLPEVKTQDLILYLKVRFRNHQEREVKVPIHAKWGIYLYEIKDQDYLDVGGIVTYYAEIRSNECTLAFWKHPLWVDLISFEENK